MRKISYWLLIVMAVLIVISCGKDDPELALINPGLYVSNQDIKLNGESIPMKQQVRYNSDGTFEATNFEKNVAVDEIKGKYKVENKQLISYDAQVRPATPWGEWKQKKDLSEDIRKIKKGSYQYYFKYPDEKLRKQYIALGLSEGWKEYKRISD